MRPAMPTVPWPPGCTPSRRLRHPDLQPGGGTYGPAQSVTISTTTGGASIRYTTNGTTPSSTVGTVYSSPVSITATCHAAGHRL